MKQMTEIDVKAYALAEIKALVNHGTLNELGNLFVKLDKLDGKSPVNCVYGLMTGNCHSERSNELIVKARQPVYFKMLPSTDSDGEMFSQEEICEVLNEHKSCKMYYSRGNTAYPLAREAFSPLEAVLAFDKAWVLANLVKYGPSELTDTDFVRRQLFNPKEKSCDISS